MKTKISILALSLAASFIWCHGIVYAAYEEELLDDLTTGYTTGQWLNNQPSGASNKWLAQDMGTTVETDGISNYIYVQNAWPGNSITRDYLDIFDTIGDYITFYIKIDNGFIIPDMNVGLWGSVVQTIGVYFYNKGTYSEIYAFDYDYSGGDIPNWAQYYDTGYSLAWGEWGQFTLKLISSNEYQVIYDTTIIGTFTPEANLLLNPPTYFVSTVQEYYIEEGFGNYQLKDFYREPAGGGPDPDPPDDPPGVPEPGTMALLMIGITGFLVKKFRAMF